MEDRILLRLLTIFASMCLLPVCSSAASPDAAAMQALAARIKPLPPGWSASPGSDPCGSSPSWKGVSCSGGRVAFISLQSMSLSGSLPSDISSLSGLQSLSLQNNLLSGPLPSFEGLSDLQEMYLGVNNFSSIPPKFFSGLSNLVNVSLDKNPLEKWSIPPELEQSVNLASFSAMLAGVTGPIPDFLGKMVSLQMLRLSYNNLVGTIPASFSGSGLRQLILNNQNTNLTGSIAVIASMTQLTDVWLQSNNFVGIIPDLSNCTQLANLELRDNKLSGIVPPSLAKLPMLKKLMLANNFLQGPIPDIPSSIWIDKDDSGNGFCNQEPGPCDPRVTLMLQVAEGFGYPITLASSWRGNDPCNNWKYVTCDSQKNITTMNFANLSLGGFISPSFANITSLKNLILNGNNLQGTIPPGLTMLPLLQLLDVSDNNLSGDIPSFRPTVKFKYSGNKLLGTSIDSPGGSSPGSGPGGDSSSDQTASGGNKSKVSAGLIVGVVVAIFVVFGAAGGIVFLRRRKHPKFMKVQVQSPPNELEVVKIVANGSTYGTSLTEMQRHETSTGRATHAIDANASFMSMQAIRVATNNFSEGNVLGKGGFGTVYKGELADGMLIAVKRMECGKMGKQGLTEFQAEISVLSKVRHRHLVALHGYCMEGNERLLVYEYMPQGTLAQHLFGGVEMGYASLTWKQRLVIAVDVARGLEYLHSLAQTSFIHRDLKPSNVLLDDHMRAKVSDFGLVKLAPDGKQSMETRLAGTFGYLSPEYATTGRVSIKVDVYAFGVVLMELITGKKALDETLPEESTHLVPWFHRVLITKGNMSKVADPSLDLDEDDIRVLKTVAELAGHCTARNADQRPNMSHAVSVLAPLVDQWKPSSSSDYDENVGMSYNDSLSQTVKRWQQNEGTSMADFNSSSYTMSMDNTQESSPTKHEMFPHCR